MQKCKHISKGLKTSVEDAVNFPGDYQHSMSFANLGNGNLTPEDDEDSDEDPDAALDAHEVVSTTEANTDSDRDSSELEDNEMFEWERIEEIGRHGKPVAFFQLRTEE